MADEVLSWPQKYRQALEEAGPGVELDDELVDAVLALAREVAHGTERRYAPLATFLAGQYVARRAEAGVSAPAALAEARAVARRCLPPEPE